MVPAATATVRSPAISCAFAIAASTPSVTKWSSASGWASTHAVGTWWVSTTTGTPIVWTPSHPSVKSNSVRPHTSAPSPSSQARMCSALAGLRCNVMRSSTVRTSTSPFCNQSKSRPIVLSCLAM